jgi:DnaJ-class molecular chaperone
LSIKANHYLVLNVKAEATDKEIVKARNERLRHLHPDKIQPKFNKLVSEATQVVNGAHDTLRDAAKISACSLPLSYQQLHTVRL